MIIQTVALAASAGFVAGVIGCVLTLVVLEAFAKRLDARADRRRHAAAVEMAEAVQRLAAQNDPAERRESEGWDHRG
jgi:hypothetical protein